MADSGDMKAHEETYRSVTGLLKRGAITFFVAAFLIMWLIS